MDDTKLMTVAQSAEQLNVSPATVRRMIQRCSIRCSRIGRSLRLKQADVEAFIANATIGGAGEGKATEPTATEPVRKPTTEGGKP